MSCFCIILLYNQGFVEADYDVKKIDGIKLIYVFKAQQPISIIWALSGLPKYMFKQNNRYFNVVLPNKF